MMDGLVYSAIPSLTYATTTAPVNSFISIHYTGDVSNCQLLTIEPPILRFASMKLRPLSDRIVVIRSQAATKSTGGLFVPATAQERPVEGMVVAVGAGKRMQSGKQMEMSIKVGDRVLFAKYSGTEVEMDGVEQLLLREDDVLATLEVPAE